MGLFEKIFKRPSAAEQIMQAFRTLNAYTPVFTSRAGSLYEMELTRGAVHAFATQASKLKPEVQGAAKPDLAVRLQQKPNPFMDTTKFLYRTATILETETTAFLVPITDETGRTFEGVFPILPSRAEIVEYQGEPWLRYTFSNGQKAVIEFDRVGILTKFQRKDDFFGDGNAALDPTLDLLDVQRQGMTEGIKNSAAIRFMGRLGQVLRDEDIKAERDRFSKENLSAENTSGLMLFDAKYADMKQIEGKQFVIDAAQMELIKANVFSYFGCSEAILQNTYDENSWNAYYEGKIEPFALQMGLVLSNMAFTEQERAKGSAIVFSSNRLQYASNTTKLAVVKDLSDRGMMSNWDGCDVFNLPHPVDADGNELPERWVIRGEYIDAANLPGHSVDQAKGYLQMKPGAKDPLSPTAGAPVADLQATVLNGAQIAALIQVVTSFKNEELTLGQAANIVAVALAISAEEAKKIVEGSL